MQVTRIDTPLSQIAVDALVVPFFSDGPRPGAFVQADEATGGLLSQLVERKELTGKKYELVTLLALSGIAAKQLVVLGLGERSKFDSGVAFRAAAAAARQLAGKPRDRVGFALGDTLEPHQTEAAVAGAIVGCTGQDLYRAEKKRTPFAELLWADSASADTSQRNNTTATAADSNASKISGSSKMFNTAEASVRAFNHGIILGESINLTRRLVNEPPQDMYPESFAARAAEVAQSCGLEIEVWDQARLEQERCGSLLAVNKGSSRPPRLVILQYRGAAANAPLLALVGKGVTFDSGGLSLKPSDGMLTMKCDMAGAATVLGAMQAIARLKLPINVVALAGLVENMTGPAAMKLGDVLHARNGRTIEVHNTDAEGRLVLADVLNIAVETGASKIIDLATLTGACVVALGQDVVGAMTNHQSWCDAIVAAANRSGEAIWQLPMFADYDDQIKSEVADIKNVGDGRWGGAITAAKFLEQFVDGRAWVHLDIAGPAFVDKAKPWTDGGASGVMVRTLVEVARAWR